MARGSEESAKKPGAAGLPTTAGVDLGVVVSGDWQAVKNKRKRRRKRRRVRVRVRVIGYFMIWMFNFIFLAR